MCNIIYGLAKQLITFVCIQLVLEFKWNNNNFHNNENSMMLKNSIPNYNWMVTVCQFWNVIVIDWVCVWVPKVWISLLFLTFVIIYALIDVASHRLVKLIKSSSLRTASAIIRKQNVKTIDKYSMLLVLLIIRKSSTGKLCGNFFFNNWQIICNCLKLESKKIGAKSLSMPHKLLLKTWHSQ